MNDRLLERGWFPHYFELKGRKEEVWENRKVVSGWYVFLTIGHRTKEECLNLQTKCGFHPAGYGFFEWEFHSKGYTTWQCANNCH